MSEDKMHWAKLKDGTFVRMKNGKAWDERGQKRIDEIGVHQE